MVNLDEVLTFSEAAEKWGLADGKTIRKAVERQRFLPHEIKKSGNVWLTTYEAMYRVFGEPRNHPAILFFKDLYKQDFSLELKKFLEAAQTVINNGELVSIVESKEHPEKIICILKTMEDLEGMKRRLQYFLKGIEENN